MSIYSSQEKEAVNIVTTRYKFGVALYVLNIMKVTVYTKKFNY